MPELSAFEGQAVVPVRLVEGQHATTTNLASAATTNPVNLKATPAKLYSLDLFNFNAAARSVKIYDKASAPTVGTDVPVMCFTIAAKGSVQRSWPSGLKFNVGLAYAMTTEDTIAGTTAVGANDVVGKITWL